LRTRDLVPLALLGAIAALIVVQGREMGRHRKGRQAPVPQSVSAESTTTVAPQGQPTPPPTPRPRQNFIDVVPPAELRASEEPAPLRDDAVIREQIKENEVGTYIRAILQQQQQMLMRWPQRQREALRVYIARDVNISDWDPNYPVAAEKAFEEWKQAGFPLRFDIVTDRVNADILILWVDRFSANDGLRIGLTNKARDQSGWLVSAEITIATHTSDGEKLSQELIAGVARHEVGHALGLGHSTNTADVMYPESTTPVISDADRSTLHLLYMLPPGTVK
jgi:predicted Zn-dependent protease